MYDGAAPLPHPPPPRKLAPHQRGGEVDGHGLVPRGQVGVDDRPDVGVGGGVVDQDVDGAEAGHGGFDRGLGVLRAADVAGHPGAGRADLGRGRLAALGPPAGDHHPGPLGYEGGGDGLADPPRPPGDQRRLALEPRVHPAIMPDPLPAHASALLVVLANVQSLPVQKRMRGELLLQDRVIGQQRRLDPAVVQ